MYIWKEWGYYNGNSICHTSFVPDIYWLGYLLLNLCSGLIFRTWQSFQSLHGNISHIILNEELLQKILSSETLTRFMLIHCSYHPYRVYQICNETPKYTRNTKIAVRLLGFMFNFQTWLACHACGVMSSALTEQILLYCKENEMFQTCYGRNCYAGLVLVYGQTDLLPATSADNLFAML